MKIVADSTFKTQRELSRLNSTTLQVSWSSTMDGENKLYDGFNGILYHVTSIDRQINVRFSSKELYQKFVQSLNN